MKTKKIITFSLLLCALYTLSYAQESINTAGGSSVDPELISYSIGQVFYEPFHGEFNVIPGVQQPYEVSPNVVEYPEGIDLMVKVYPNPVNHIILLEMDEQNLSSLKISLMDINGTTLLNQKITGTTTKIPVENLVPGIYLLNIIRDDKVLKAFKIVKH